MTKIETEEIKLSPKEKAFANYQFVRADVREGLNYGVSLEFYNESMKEINSTKRAEHSVTAKEFEEDFRHEWNRIRKEQPS